MNNNEILAKIEKIEKELQELKNIISNQLHDEDFEFDLSDDDETGFPVEDAQEELFNLFGSKNTNSCSMQYNPKEFDIKDGVLHKYIGTSEEVNVPYGIIKIGNRAFYDNETIKKVNFPYTVIEVDEQAFERCTNLIEVNISLNTVKIGIDAFYCCKSLEKINIDNVKEISDYAFALCESLKNLRFSDNIKKIGVGAFYDCKNLIISIPNTCTYVEATSYIAGSFEHCKRVEIRGNK